MCPGENCPDRRSSGIPGLGADRTCVESKTILGYKTVGRSGMYIVKAQAVYHRINDTEDEGILLR